MLTNSYLILASSIPKWPLAAIRNYKANFGCLRMNGLSNIFSYPDNILWTPAYGCYDKLVRRDILQFYKEKGLTHFIIQLRGFPYRHYFPELNQRDNALWLDEIYSAGLLPVCNLYADDDVTLQIKSDVLRMIQCAFTTWDGAQGFDTVLSNGNVIGPNIDKIRETKSSAPHIELYWHFSANYGTCTSPETAFWFAAKDAGIRGFLWQTYFEGPFELIIKNTIDRSADVQLRFAGFHNWPTGIDLINFENTEFHALNDPHYWTEERCNEFNHLILSAPLPIQEGYTGVPYNGYGSGK